ncbi:MAG: hypothetical protein GC191_15100 [Azospirillum sp.]|nr:hypothetical protein [Azospirillum sp.]
MTISSPTRAFTCAAVLATALGTLSVSDLAAAQAPDGRNGFTIAAADTAPATEPSVTDRAKKEAAEAYEAIRDYTFAKKDDFVSWASRQYNTASEELDRLVKENGPAVSETIAAQQKQAAEAIASLRESVESSWPEAKESAYQALKNLKAAISEQFSQPDISAEAPTAGSAAH